MWTLLEIGGPVLWLLFGCSILLVALFFERQVALHRCRVYLHDFLPGLTALLREHRYSEAMQICAATPGPVARVCRTLILEGRDASRSERRDLAEISARLEIPHLERQMPLLAALCYLAPLLGLLGTFLGLLEAFSAASTASGPVNAARLAEGIYSALINACAGLMIAIPAYAAHLYLHGRVQRLTHEIQRAAFDVINVMSAHPPNLGGIIEFDPGHTPDLTRSQQPE